MRHKLGCAPGIADLQERGRSLSISWALHSFSIVKKDGKKINAHPVLSGYPESTDTSQIPSLILRWWLIKVDCSELAFVLSTFQIGIIISLYKSNIYSYFVKVAK